MAYQRQNWQTNESGILRKKEEKDEQLLVFGYSCKLFRDDEKALHIDQGKHLIPWMGDDSLRIDRYDVRGALYDLSQFEAVSGKQEELFWVNLSNEERRIEQLCDEERYRALTHNEDEEALYQEEELKRLHQALGSDKTYGQVSYSYDDDNGDGENDKPAKENNQAEESDEPFVVPLELDIPQGMAVPETVKLNAIIEKTAMFIHQQGSQMEIILKMKQATNPQFDFLSYNSTLHNYYRHLLGAIKTGRYKPKVQTTNNQTNEDACSADQNYYLHHSLSQVPSSSFNVAPSIPTINYKPSADCAYSMLVNKIRGNQNKFSLLNKLTAETTNEVSDSQDIVSESNSGPDASCSPKLCQQPEITSENHNESDSNDAKQRPTSPPQRVSRKKRRKRQQGAFAYNDCFEQEMVDGTEFAELDSNPDCQNEYYEPENPDSIEDRHEITPPSDLQLIVEKMASYVAKNGRDFEEIVKSKNDPRFSFLNNTSSYYPYYRKKVEHFESEQPVVNMSAETNLNDENCNAHKSDKEGSAENGEIDKMAVDPANNTLKVSSTSKPNPVCFSIKRPKETEGLEIKSALPIEESSEEDNEEGEDNVNISSSGCNNKDMADNNSETRDKPSEADLSAKYIEDKKDANAKQKEDRLKDKVKSSAKSKKASPVKVKLSAKEKEKQLQLERKKRAAAFLNLIQKVNRKSSEKVEKSGVMIGPQLPDDPKALDKTESASGNEEDEKSDSDSVSSLPSSVTSPDVMFICDQTANESDLKQKDTVLTEPLTLPHRKTKCSKHATASKYSVSRHLNEKDGADYWHKHRKRKRSRTPERKHHSHSGRSHYHRSNKESKHRKHHRQHHKDWRRGEKDYNINASGGSVHRRHKHYKLKKHKRKEDKKHNSSKSSVSDESDSD